jgi:transposase
LSIDRGPGFGTGAYFAKSVGASETEGTLLVLDGAGWHKSSDVEWSTAVHPIFLPSYSPELKPAERLWPLVREARANRLVRSSLDELEAIVVDRCQRLTGMPDHLRSCTRLLW